MSKGRTGLGAIVATTLFVAVCGTHAQGQTHKGATGSFVDGNGNPTSSTVTLPDCKSCKVTQTGPNDYSVKIPRDVRQKVNGK